MAKKRGTGMAAVSYPIGMHLGGDPTGALVHATSGGNFVVAMSSVDLGQGLKTVMAQIAAEAKTTFPPHCDPSLAKLAPHLEA